MSTQPPAQVGRFPEFFASLISAIGYHADVVPTWLYVLMQRRVLCIRDRILALMEKLRVGTYRAPTPRVPRPETTGTAQEPAKKRAPRRHFPEHLTHMMPADARLPTKFAWMTRLLRNTSRPWPHLYNGAASTELLQHLLQADPEIQEFAKTCPALAGQLRALCHMLGLKPPHIPAYLALPPRPRKPRPPKLKREKAEKFVIYKYWCRPRLLPADRLRRFAKKSSKW
jgi:hypothetical protein